MVHHLWYDNFDQEIDDVRSRRSRGTHTRQPAPRRGGARRAVAKALIELGERIAPDNDEKQAAGK
jgi:hypothetical protein